MIKKLHNLKFLIGFLAIGTLGFSQQLDIEKLHGIEPRNIGPAGMSGRFTTIDVVVDNPDIIYAGSASGGLWKSESGGIHWEPIFEKEQVASIGAVHIQQSNPSVVWAGTGEGNPRNSVTGGYGIYKSLDAGKTWKLMGLEKTRNIHRIVVDPTNPNVIYVGAIGSSWGEHPERGVYKSTNGGESWDKILFNNNRTGCADLVMDPSNPNKLIAAMWEHQRKPWTFNSGGSGSGLYTTHDGGLNWKKMSPKEGIPKGNLGRIGLAIAPSNPDRIYALIESKKNALYGSEDGGFNWKKISDKPGIGNRPFYYSDIFVDPVNEYRIYSVFTYINVSNDGGKSFSQLMPAYNTSKGVHPDHHAWWIHPKDPTYIIDGNDGGLNISRDHGKTWRFIATLPVAQYYHINVDNDFPYNVYGGMQDNGSWAGPAYVLKSQGIRNSYFQELMFGDGFDVIPDPKNSRYGFAMSQGGSVGYYDRETGYTRYVQPTHPKLDTRLRFNWNAAIAMDATDNQTVYYGSQFLHKSTDYGYTWDIISPDLTTDDKEKQKQHESGGLTLDATGAENYCTIVSIAPSSLNNSVIWVGTDDGNIQLTQDGGSTWNKVNPKKLKGFPQDGWVTQIKASTYNPDEAFVVINNYRNFDFKPYLYKVSDYGRNWERLASDDSVWGYCLSFIQDPEVKNLMFLGTEFGLYVSIDAGSTWTKWTNKYPTVSTMDLAIQSREKDLVIGTFGRSAFVMDDIRPLQELAKKGTSILNEKIHVFDTPDAYLSVTQQPTGSRFGANALFNGENRKRGAMISYVINKPKKEVESKKDKDVKADEKKEKKKSVDSITFKFFDATNKQIRTLKRKAPKKNGLNRTYWNLTEKGINRPSRKKARSNREPSGQLVLPGRYKVRMVYAQDSSEAFINVKLDPRIEKGESTAKAVYDFNKKVSQHIEKATEATKRLVESKELIKDLKAQLKKRSIKDEDMDKRNKEVLKEIDSLFALFLGKESKRQGIERDPTPTPLTYLNRTYRYSRGILKAPGETEQRLLNQGVEKLTKALEKVNNFYNTEWVEYRKKVENLNLSPFKDYTPIR